MMKGRLIQLLSLFLITAVSASLLVLVSRHLLFEPEGKINQEALRIERNVIPVKASVFREAVNDIGTLKSSSEGWVLTLPSASAESLCVDQLAASEEKYGVILQEQGGSIEIQMKKGDNSVVCVPAPMFLALVDQGRIDLTSEQ